MSMLSKNTGQHFCDKGVQEHQRTLQMRKSIVS